jgi:hypothetical protein
MILYGGTYLPRAGDDEATIQQKRAARARATEGIRMGLGPAEILFKEREAQKQGAQPGAQPAPQQSASPPGGQAPQQAPAQQQPAPGGGYDTEFDALPENTPAEGEDGQVYMKRSGKLWRQTPNGWEEVR